ncbi:MAG: M48 family peptidase, partial [Cyclobacteriaceae bacterium]|nr:M48 family peptidase [Cyclobacteriaceae bacterium]
MEPQQLLYLILIFVILDFVFDQLLDFINLKYQKKDIPSEVASFYDKDKYLKSLDYQRINTRFGFITATLSFIISVAMLYYGGFGD